MMDNDVVGFERNNVEGRTYRTVWSGMKFTDVGKPLSLPSVDKASVQVFGSWGGATVIFVGSNEMVQKHSFNLVDEEGMEVSLSSTGGAMISSLTTWFQPRIIGGDETTDLTVILLDRRVM